MLHAEVIAQKVLQAERENRLTLREYSVRECQQVCEHFRSMEQTDGKSQWYCRKNQDGSLTAAENFAFADWEQAFIRNELMLCACSFVYWFYRYFHIKRLDNTIVLPEVLIAQQIVIDMLAQKDLASLPILLFSLKARQLGISTLIEAMILWIALFRRGSHCVIASAEEQKSVEMSEMIWLALEKMPLWMQPTLTRENRQIGPEFGENGSDILIQHGSQKKGIGRGSTPVAAHLSEVAYFPDPIETIQSSLIRAMHENPRTFLVLESTARRKGDWFHQQWLKNREGEETGYNRFICSFLPWYVGRDKYPTVDWLRNHPIPGDWKPLQETLRQSQDAKLYVATTPLLSKYLGPSWEMSREQMWYYEFSYWEAKNSNDEKEYKSFRAELASDERTAFQSVRTSVFEVETLDALAENAEKAKYTDYAIQGDGIPARYALREFQAQTRRIDINWPSPTTGKSFHWRLVPLRETPHEQEEKCDFYVRVWERPKPGYRYTVAVDIGTGIGQNKFVIEVLRTGDMAEPAVQVAEFASRWIGSYDGASFVLAISVWYGQFMSPVNEALLAPEVQIATGDFISDHCANLGYSNFYYMERFDLQKKPGQRSMRRGWASVGWSIPMRDEYLEYAIRSGWVQIYSEKLLEELSSLEAEEMESGKVKYDHADKEENDCYVALGIANMAALGHVSCMERIKSKLRPTRQATVLNEETATDTQEARLARFLQQQEAEMEYGMGEHRTEVW